MIKSGARHMVGAVSIWGRYCCLFCWSFPWSYHTHRHERGWTSFTCENINQLYCVDIKYANTKYMLNILMTDACLLGFAAVGSAAMPFVTGVLASKFGIKSLQPL
jgi:hypothetical protein